MAGAKKIPLMYEVVIRDLLSRSLKNRPPLRHGEKPIIEIARFRKQLAIIYHMPKELHYALMREFERYGTITIDHSNVKILRTNGELK